MARAKRSGRDRGGSLPGPGGEPIAHDTPRTSDLVRPGGKIDKAAVYRAAMRQQEQSRHPDDVVMEGEEGGDGEAPAPRVVFKLGRDLDKRLDKYLADRVPFMSRAQLQRLIDDGGVLVNGKAAKPSTNLRLGDIVEVSVPPPRAEDIAPEDIPLDVMFEDEHLIVLNKSPDIMVHPARAHLSGTLVNALSFHFRNRSTAGGSLSGVGREFARPGVVHRLDRQTSGVIVFAKSEHAHWQLAKQFMDRTVDKRYLAIVHGLLEPRIDVIDLPLGPHPSREKGYREKQVIRHDHLGKPAVTVYRVLGQYAAQPVEPINKAGIGGIGGSGARKDVFSLVEVELKTGRTHQIRVHLSHLGFPLAGDDMYGGKLLDEPNGLLIERVALHAALLTFRHPATNETMRFQAPFPADLARLIAALRRWPTCREYRGVPGAVFEPAAIG